MPIVWREMCQDAQILGAFSGQVGPSVVACWPIFGSAEMCAKKLLAINLGALGWPNCRDSGMSVTVKLRCKLSIMTSIMLWNCVIGWNADSFLTSNIYIGLYRDVSSLSGHLHHSSIFFIPANEMCYLISFDPSPYPWVAALRLPSKRSQARASGEINMYKSVQRAWVCLPNSWENYAKTSQKSRKSSSENSVLSSWFFSQNVGNRRRMSQFSGGPVWTIITYHH